MKRCKWITIEQRQNIRFIAELRRNRTHKRTNILLQTDQLSFVPRNEFELACDICIDATSNEFIREFSVEYFVAKSIWRTTHWLKIRIIRNCNRNQYQTRTCGKTDDAMTLFHIATIYLEILCARFGSMLVQLIHSNWIKIANNATNKWSCYPHRQTDSNENKPNRRCQWVQRDNYFQLKHHGVNSLVLWYILIWTDYSRLKLPTCGFLQANKSRNTSITQVVSLF